MNTGVTWVLVIFVAGAVYYGLQTITFHVDMDLHIMAPKSIVYDVIKDPTLEGKHPFVEKTEVLEWKVDDSGEGWSVVRITEKVPWVWRMEINVTNIYSRAKYSVTADARPTSYLHVINKWTLHDKDENSCVLKEHVELSLPRIFKYFTEYNVLKSHSELLENFKDQAEQIYKEK